MLLHLNQIDYINFKNGEAYRIRRFRTAPVKQVSDIVQLGYLDVNRTIKRIKPLQSLFIKNNVIDFINNLITKPPVSQSVFDQQHHQCCTKCTSSIGSATIHYGQAQKLLNMSLKYLYNEFAFYKSVKNYLGFPSNNIEYFFHLPVDNQIISYLVTHCYFKLPTSSPWSKWTDKHYIEFQTTLRSKLINNYQPLEIDYLVWNNPNAKLYGKAIH